MLLAELVIIQQERRDDVGPVMDSSMAELLMNQQHGVELGCANYSRDYCAEER